MVQILVLDAVERNVGVLGAVGARYFQERRADIVAIEPQALRSQDARDRPVAAANLKASLFRSDGAELSDLFRVFLAVFFKLFPRRAARQLQQGILAVFELPRITNYIHYRLSIRIHEHASRDALIRGRCAIE